MRARTLRALAAHLSNELEILADEKIDPPAHLIGDGVP
jgi:hypothetical protein